MRRTLAGIALFLCVLPAALYAHSLTLSGGVDNFMYGQDSEGSADVFTLPSLVPIINIGIDGEFSTFSRYNLTFEKDPILRNVTSGNMTFNLWAFRLGVGAFMSMFNAKGEEYIPGVSGSIGLEIPGVFSAYVEYGLSVNPDANEPANINLNYGKVETALWLPGIIGRLIIQRKSFTMTPSDTLILNDSLLRYQVSLDFFSKSSTFQLTLGAGYETLERDIGPIAGTLAPREEAFDTPFAFADLSFALNPDLAFLLNIEVPLSSAAAGYFFKAVTGFRFKMPDL
jgi:hypothetical protein